MKKVSNFDEVPVEKLRWRCDPNSLGFDTTDELKVCPDIIGQRRAVNAIRLGLDIESFNELFGDFFKCRSLYIAQLTYLIEFRKIFYAVHRFITSLFKIYTNREVLPSQ